MVKASRLQPLLLPFLWSEACSLTSKVCSLKSPLDFAAGDGIPLLPQEASCNDGMTDSELKMVAFAAFIRILGVIRRVQQVSDAVSCHSDYVTP